MESRHPNNDVLPEDESCIPLPDFLVTVGVYFPQGDLPVLLKRMKRHPTVAKTTRRLSSAGPP